MDLDNTFKEYCLKTLAEKDEKIDLKLIEEFMCLSETEEQFPIPIEKLVEWGIDVNKDHALARLRKLFALNIDFTYTFAKNLDSTGGRPRKLTHLSLDCFRMLCLQSQSEKGKMLLQSLLAIDRLRKEHSQNQLRKLQSENDHISSQLEDERKNTRDLQAKYNRSYRRKYHKKFGYRGPTFYVIFLGVARVKIGISGCRSKNPESLRTLDERLAIHRSSWPELQVKFVVYSDNALLLETILKRAYRLKRTLGSHEIFDGVIFNEVIESAKSILRILDVVEDEPTFKIEERLELFNSEDFPTKQSDSTLQNSTLSSSASSSANDNLNHASDHIEINHREFKREDVRLFLDDLPKLNINGLKTTCRKFRVATHKKSKSALKNDLETLFRNALNNSENIHDEKSDNLTPITITYDPENLPRGISFCKKNGEVAGFKLTVGLGGNVYESTFVDKSKSMSDKFQEALQLQQDLRSEFNLTGSIDWENRKRHQVVRLGICVGCGKEVSKTSSLCQSCASKQDSAVPPKDRLLAMLREHKGNLSAVGRDLQRTDAAVRKWLIEYGFTREEIKNRSFL